MNRILLLGLAVHLSFIGIGQTNSHSKSYNKVYTKKLASDNEKAIPGIYKKPNHTIASRNNKDSYEEEVLANSFYDLQTNGAVARRLIMDTSGNMAAVWTASTENSQTWTDRGSGYSFFNGTAWSLSADYPRIESVRCGWPNIMFPASGGEVVISHQSIPSGTTTDTKLRFNSRPTKGSGSWTEKLVSNTDLTWPRATIGGTDGNSIHLIAVSDAADSNRFDKLRRALVYYRSEDGGSTFNITDSVLPGLRSADVGPIGGDNYAISSIGDTIVIALFDTWNDVLFLRSEDNGDTWTKTVALNNPIAKTDIVTDLVLDTPDLPDGSGALLLEPDGTVHLSWGWISAFNDALEPPDEATFSFFGFRDGLLYWNEDKPADDIDTIARVVDQNNNGVIALTGGFPNYGSGLTSMPSMGLADDGTIYVSYAGIHEDLNDGDATPENYRHIYIINSTDNGDTWSDPVDINPNDEFTENVFASINANISGEHIHMLFQRDSDPGVGTTAGQPTTDNEIVYAKINRRLNVGVEAYTETISGLSIYPNPTKDMVTINFNLKKPDQVTTSIVNVTGQTVFETQRQVTNSSQNNVLVDVSHLPAGIYIVNVIPSEGKNIAQKLIIE